jgi:hypothetical protein
MAGSRWRRACGQLTLSRPHPAQGEAPLPMPERMTAGIPRRWLGRGRLLPRADRSQSRRWWHARRWVCEEGATTSARESDTAGNPETAHLRRGHTPGEDQRSPAATPALSPGWIVCSRRAVVGPCRNRVSLKTRSRKGCTICATPVASGVHRCGRQTRANGDRGVVAHGRWPNPFQKRSYL